MMKKINLAYIISNISKVIMFEWISQKINKDKYELTFIFLNNSVPITFSHLKSRGFKCYYIEYENKKHIPKALLSITKILIKEKIEIVHAHLFEASLIGLLAAKLIGIKKRIYTRHHSDYHHIYHPKGVKFDNFINLLSTDIIAISKNVRKILLDREKYTNNKITLIYHGFDLESFALANEIEIDKIKSKWQINKNKFIIGMVSRLVNWKSVDVAIFAFKILLTQTPNIQLVIANANGEKNYVNYIYSLCRDIPKDSIIFIDYEENMSALYQSFDIFLHIPEDPNCEAFGQVYIEAMAAKTLCVVTLSGIANEFIINNYNAIVVEYKSIDSVYQALDYCIENKFNKEKLITNAYNDVFNLFSINQMINNLENLYII
jgi:glycosyltransferase involved in cell wall biosynthesis